MKQEIISHTQLPNQMDDLTPEDKLIYLSIKRFQNHKTGKCFPSLATIAKIEKMYQLQFILIIFYLWLDSRFCRQLLSFLACY